MPIEICTLKSTHLTSDNLGRLNYFKIFLQLKLLLGVIMSIYALIEKATS